MFFYLCLRDELIPVLNRGMFGFSVSFGFRRGKEYGCFSVELSDRVDS